MCVPFKHICVTIHSLKNKDRMDQAAINFSVAMGFGDRDVFSSDVGGEDILNICKNNSQYLKLSKTHLIYKLESDQYYHKTSAKLNNT